MTKTTGLMGILALCAVLGCGSVTARATDPEATGGEADGGSAAAAGGSGGIAGNAGPGFAGAPGLPPATGGQPGGAGSPGTGGTSGSGGAAGRPGTGGTGPSPAPICQDVGWTPSGCLTCATPTASGLGCAECPDVPGWFTKNQGCQQDAAHGGFVAVAACAACAAN